MLPFLLTAFLGGLAGSPHCVAMCGAFASACAVHRPGFAAWHAGRLVSYATLGAVAGAAGQFIPGPPWVPAVLATGMLLWFALALAGLVREPAIPIASFSRLGWRLAGRPGLVPQFGFGVINGFLPCGLVYSALSLPVALGQAGPGAMAMLAFGAGTIPLLSAAALLLRRVTAASMPRRRLLAAVVLLLGLAAIGMRSGLIAAGHEHPGATAHQMGD
jgi:sulfite exporter TauE/SafE